MQGSGYTNCSQILGVGFIFIAEWNVSRYRNVCGGYFCEKSICSQMSEKKQWRLSRCFRLTVISCGNIVTGQMNNVVALEKNLAVTTPN
ncbi:hypothetical protein LC603019_01504 [Lawsonella clevelandensis]|uniref:Uncharacterized protein n=1 Tax=Lawsonella clevelandensis TaxID=1528099 RepID=A0A5E3ZYP9_9ACTN|nr:hypothetical protein LC603019_01504 [Lawsonella clevelandensis]